MFVESSLHGERAAVCQQDAPLDPVVLSSVNEPDVSGWLSCFALVWMLLGSISLSSLSFFYIRGIWANVHSKLKLSIKVTPCVLCSCFYSSTCSNMFRLRTLSKVSVGGRVRRTWPWSSPWRFNVELMCVLTRLLSCCCRRMWFCSFTCSAAHRPHQTCWVRSRAGLQQDAIRLIIDRTQSADTDWSTGSPSSIQPRCKTDPTKEKWRKPLVMYVVIVSQDLNTLWWIKVFTDKAGRHVFVTQYWSDATRYKQINTVIWTIWSTVWYNY